MDWGQLFSIGSRALAHRNELARIQELSAPLITAAQPLVDEFKRVQPELMPLVWTLIGVFFPKFRDTAVKQGGVEFSVFWIQTSLNKLIDLGKLKHSKVTVDGNYGAETSAAVEAYQTQKGFARDDIDGWFGIQTLTHVLTDLEAGPQ